MIEFEVLGGDLECPSLSLLDGFLCDTFPLKFGQGVKVPLLLGGPALNILSFGELFGNKTMSVAGLHGLEALEERHFGVGPEGEEGLVVDRLGVAWIEGFHPILSDESAGSSQILLGRDRTAPSESDQTAPIHVFKQGTVLLGGSRGDDELVGGNPGVDRVGRVRVTATSGTPSALVEELDRPTLRQSSRPAQVVKAIFCLIKSLIQLRELAVGGVDGRNGLLEGGQRDVPAILLGGSNDIGDDGRVDNAFVFQFATGLAHLAHALCHAIASEILDCFSHSCGYRVLTSV